MNKKNILLAVGGLVLLALVFWGGMIAGKKSQNNKAFSGNQFNVQGAAMNGFGNQSGQNRDMVNRANGFGGGTSGEVIAKDGNSLTLKLKDGGSKIVLYSTSTNVVKMASSTVSDIQIGEQLTVTGSSNSDGSISAESIQAR